MCPTLRDRGGTGSLQLQRPLPKSPGGTTGWPQHLAGPAPAAPRDRCSVSAGPWKQPSRSHVESPQWPRHYLMHRLTPAGASPVGRPGRLENTQRSEREKSGADGRGRGAGAHGWVCSGDTEPFALHPHPFPEVCSLRAAGHGSEKGAVEARARPGWGALDMLPLRRRRAGWHGSGGGGKAWAGWQLSPARN